MSEQLSALRRGSKALRTRNSTIEDKRIALARSGAKFPSGCDSAKHLGLNLGVGMLLRLMNPVGRAGHDSITQALVIEVASDDDMREDPNRPRVSLLPSHILEGHHVITRVGQVHVPGQGFVLIPDGYNELNRHKFIPGMLEDVPKDDRCMNRLVAGLVKNFEEAGIDDQMRPVVLASTIAKTAAATATPWVPPVRGVRDVLDDSDDDLDDNRPIHQVGDTDDDSDSENGANGCSRDDSDDVACVDPTTLPDKQRKGGRPTRKSLRSTSLRAGAAGSPVDLVREQRDEEEATRKKASKVASGDPLDVEGGSEQPPHKGNKKASAKTRKAGGKKKAPAKTKKTAGKKKASEPVSESESESNSDTTLTLRSARRKVTPEQRKKLTEMSKSTWSDRMKERDAAFAAADEVSRKRTRMAVLAQEGVQEAKMLKRKKAEAKSSAVAARKAPPGTKKRPATLDPSAAKSKKSLNKAAPSTKQPAERAAPAAANLNPSKNDQASKDPVSTSPSNKSGREEKKTRDDTTSTANRLTASEKSFLERLLAKQNGVESGDSEEDDDESVDDLEDARAEPHGDLANGDSQAPATAKLTKKASLKVMREWRAALYRLRNTRIEGVNAAISTIQNDSKDGDGNVVKALVGNPMPTAKRWLVQLAAVDACHDDTCCPETKLLKHAFQTHRIKAGATEEPVASAKPKSAKRMSGKTKRKCSK